MIDTPETEKQAQGVIGWYSCATVPADFARKLERERDEANRLLAAARESLNAIHVEVGGWIGAMMKGGK